METRAEFLEKLNNINPKYDIELIGKAFELAMRLHEGQLRKSGEPYFIHPIHVAYILAEIGMDDATIVGGLLHDVVEDTDYTLEDVTKEFGEEIALLVDGVTKLGAIKYESKEEQQAENFRKMFMAMSKDIRVLIIKLADRLHNMRTMQYMKPEKIKEKCDETLEIYAPLASRLGIARIKFEMEDLALKYLHPDDFEDIVNQIENLKSKREDMINTVIEDIKEALNEMNFSYNIYGRAKHYYSIYRKMVRQEKNLDEIFDLTAIRIIVDSVKDCYAVLGIVHTMWKPIPGRFKDYIAMPKPNMYQSLHTTVIGDNGEPFEIQIRTLEMHQVAEYGIAAHWKYKEGDTEGNQNADDLKLAWLRQSLELEKDSQNPQDFLEFMKVDLFASQVYVFTPRGDVMELPMGSTPLDFAFKVHSAVGLTCVGAKVNGKMVTIDYELQNGDIVDIVTSKNSSGPSVDWLRIAKSSNARTKIKNFLNKKQREQEALEKKPEEKPKLEKKEEPKTDDEIIEQIKAEETRKAKAEKRKKDNPGVIVKGFDNLMIKLARCCSPVPGDDIVGFITKGRGISVHRCDCSNIKSLSDIESSRLIEVEWEDLKAGKSYVADVEIHALDRRGLLSDISKVCDDLDIDLTGVKARSLPDGASQINIQLSISSTQEMERVLRHFRNIPGVEKVYRTRS